MFLNKMLFISLAVGFAPLAYSSQSTDVAGFPAEPEAAITTIVRELSKSNGGIFWQAMPAGYQTELTEIIALFASKMDDEVYDKMVSVVSRCGRILKDKRDFILNMAETMSVKRKAELQKVWPSLVGMIETLTSSQLGSTEGLRSFDGNEFFGSAVSKMLKYSDEFSRGLVDEELTMADILAETVISVVESDLNRAKLKMTFPENDHDHEEIYKFTKVEGKWIPSSTHIVLTELKEDIVAMPTIGSKKDEWMAGFYLLSAKLAKLEKAQTQEQFESALYGLFSCVS